MIRKMLVVLMISFILFGCSEGVDKELALKNAKNYFQPLPDKMPGSENDTDAKIALGKKLYFETALSSDGTLSCNSCHMVDNGRAGVDNEPTSDGVGGTEGERNSPTVYNAGLHIAQFWDGRAKDLKEQAGGPVLNPVEMAMADEASVEAKLSAIPGYKEAFSEVFPDTKEGITYSDMTEAIAAFERTLITSDRFDDFLKGDMKALSNDEVNGLNIFMEKGCVTCHSGALLGASMYQKSGLIRPYKNNKDEGRFTVTGQEADKFVFKVPSLRNVVLTGPYFHDGQISSLNEAVYEMADMQLGIKLTEQETASIVQFLHTLSGKN